MKSILIKDTTREERGTIASLYRPYIDGEKEISEINAEYRSPFVRG